MRRKERQVTELERIKQLVEDCQVVRIAFKGDEYPYIVPVNYGYVWQEDQLILYAHGATQGKKIELLQKNGKVAIEMDDHHALIQGSQNAATYSYAYQSLIGFGEAELVNHLKEKRHALHALMDHAAKGIPFDEIPDKMLERTAIIKISVATYTMKENKPKPKKTQS
ncbi:pyridoxamine 5'-phosphate oxidase [Enterococcus florum]|uniref:Pyridoxamine 5'-phosphate oxidase n=1 Tax=Enterococcus florum TaxID=2480627 RepID=A0A4P5PBB0_9ENTE|nr:pyridoxamine 5'-phosphate oxidase family protein [Enterococcus florum]GCF95437.1 pyridoxamine 5'-phosphate oxidase [Enterococcus florum]